jgi:hypothetical protein
MTRIRHDRHNAPLCDPFADVDRGPWNALVADVAATGGIDAAARPALRIAPPSGGYYGEELARRKHRRDAARLSSPKSGATQGAGATRGIRSLLATCLLVAAAATAVLLAAIAIAGTVGCGGDARVELAASDAITAAADQFGQAAGEYHAEVSRGDDRREEDVLSAFVARTQADAGNATKTEQNIAEFRKAMGNIRADREAEMTRHYAVRDNVDVLREISRGLQRIGIDSMTLSDEARRYLYSWIDTQKRAKNATGGTPVPQVPQAK